jgi:hypothetical protein
MWFFTDFLIINLFYVGKVQLMSEPDETRRRGWAPIQTPPSYYLNPVWGEGICLQKWPEDLLMT